VGSTIKNSSGPVIQPVIRPVNGPLAVLFMISLFIAQTVPVSGYTSSDSEQALRQISAGLKYDLHTLTQAEPPRISEDMIILTYRARSERRPPRHVGAVFGHEDYRRVHTFRRNQNDVYFLVIPVPKNLPERELRYRLVADGIWQADPANPSYRRDDTGFRISVLDLPSEPEAPPASPQRVSERHVEFFVEASPGSRVFLVGEMNGWDPFMHRLKEDAPGRFRLTVPIGRGVYRYQFIVNGERVPDPLNEEQQYTVDGVPVSVLRVR
jgi:hypothetical protein